MGISFQRNIIDVIHYWFYEGKNYEYNLRKCTPDYYTYTCDNYLQVCKPLPAIIYFIENFALRLLINLS